MPGEPTPATVDFESFRIRPRPYHPPVPVGVSIKRWGAKPKYWAWGHPSGNNCTWPQARKALGEVWTRPEGVLFHNSKFDVDVAEEHFGLPRLPWVSVHDTMFLLFLEDPHQLELGLKPSAERLLQMKPEERDAVGDWLCEHQPLLWAGIRISKSRQSEHYYGAYIAYAPGDLVGKYADGDVERTEKLFRLLHRRVCQERGMREAYDRERRLMPVLLELERQGIRVDGGALERDISSYGGVHDRLTEWVRKRLGSPALNVDSGPALVDAMLTAGVVDAAKLGVTAKTGRPKTDKESLKEGVTDKQLLAALKYRTQLGTCLRTFMEPWARMSAESDGLIHTTWNQTKLEHGDGTAGTRTGRLSSNPNFQNIPKEFSPIFKDKENASLPTAPFPLPPLPLVRSYVIPWKPGWTLVDRDYSQQEPRILAHFEDGALKEQYLQNPWIDFHDNAKAQLERIMGRSYQRKHVKNINLGLIYGQGLASLAMKNGSTIEETKEIKNAILAMYPGLKFMYNEMRARAMQKRPIRTWGGREYYCEEPKIIDGRFRTFDYKLVNVLIQGSAADCTKEAVLDYWERKPKNHVLYLTVHDELLISCPSQEETKAMELLRKCMERVPFDVPMLSEGKSGQNWSSLVDYDVKGTRLA